MEPIPRIDQRWVAGKTYPPIELDALDENDQPFDLSGATVTLKMVSLGGSLPVGTVKVNDLGAVPPTGPECVYQQTQQDFDSPGIYAVRFAGTLQTGETFTLGPALIEIVADI